MPSLNLDIIVAICTYLERNDIKTLSNVDSDICNVVLHNKSIYINKCIIQSIEAEAQYAELQYETKRLDRCSTLYFVDKDKKKIAEGVSNINKVGDAVIFVVGKTVNYASSGDINTVYEHTSTIRSLAIASLNVYFVDEEYKMFVLQPNINKATLIMEISAELLEKRFLYLPPFIGTFKSTLEIVNDELVCMINKGYYLLV